MGSSDSPASAVRSLDRFYHFLAKGPGNMVEDSAQLGCRKLVPDVSYYESQIHVVMIHVVMIQGLPGSFSVSDFERRAATAGLCKQGHSLNLGHQGLGLGAIAT